MLGFNNTLRMKQFLRSPGAPKTVRSPNARLVAPARERAVAQAHRRANELIVALVRVHDSGWAHTSPWHDLYSAFALSLRWYAGNTLSNRTSADHEFLDVFSARRSSCDPQGGQCCTTFLSCRF